MTWTVGAIPSLLLHQEKWGTACAEAAYEETQEKYRTQIENPGAIPPQGVIVSGRAVIDEDGASEEDSIRIANGPIVRPPGADDYFVSRLVHFSFQS